MTSPRDPSPSFILGVGSCAGCPIALLFAEKGSDWPPSRRTSDAASRSVIPRATDLLAETASDSDASSRRAVLGHSLSSQRRTPGIGS